MPKMTLLKSTAAVCPPIAVRLEDGVFQAVYYCYSFCSIKGVWLLKLWGRLSYSWVSMWLKGWVKFSSEMLRKWEYNGASAWLYFLHFLDILSLAWSHYCFEPRRFPETLYLCTKQRSLTWFDSWEWWCLSQPFILLCNVNPGLQGPACKNERALAQRWWRILIFEISPAKCS